jgi:dCMP deaminase
MSAILIPPAKLDHFTHEEIKYNLNLAAEYGITRGTCERLRVGCSLYSWDGNLLTIGANTSPNGAPSCDSSGHMLIENHCQRTIHAEQNAVGFAAKKGLNLANSVAFVSHTPCLHCAKLLIACGVSYIYYRTEYANVVSKEALLDLAEKTKVPIGLLPTN